MNFHITTKKYSVDFLENCVQYENLYIYFDGTVEYTESTNFISLFTGILWSGTLEGVPNGQFYSVKINKNYKIIEVITDFIEDFPIYYLVEDNTFILTNMLISFPPEKHRVSYTYINKVIIDKNYGRGFYPSLNKQNLNNVNATIFNNVNRISAFSKVYFNFKGKIKNTLTYLPKNYFLDSFISKYSFDDARDITKEILSSNLKKLYSNMLFLCSSGIDSVILKELKPTLKSISYSGDWWQREIILNPTHSFTKSEYINACEQEFINWNTTARGIDLAIEAHILKQYSDHKILTGTYGDEIFWHDPYGAMAVYIFKTKNKADYNSYVDFISDKYSNLITTWTEDIFYEIKNYPSFEEAMTSRLYYRGSYLKESRVLSNKLLISPYIDLRLRTLLNSCDTDTQIRSAFNAELQFSLIADTTKVNKIKAGAQEGSDILAISRETLLKNFLKNYIKFHK